MNLTITGIEEIQKSIREIISTEVKIALSEIQSKQVNKLLTKKESADMLSCCVATIDNLRREGLIKSISIRGRVMFRLCDLNDYITKNIAQ